MTEHPEFVNLEGLPGLGAFEADEAGGGSGGDDGPWLGFADGNGFTFCGDFGFVFAVERELDAQFLRVARSGISIG